MPDQTPLLFAKRTLVDAPHAEQYRGTETERDLKVASDRALKDDVQPLVAQYAGTETELDLKISDRSLKTDVRSLVAR